MSRSVREAASLHHPSSLELRRFVGREIRGNDRPRKGPGRKAQIGTVRPRSEPVDVARQPQHLTSTGGCWLLLCMALALSLHLISGFAKQDPKDPNPNFFIPRPLVGMQSSRSAGWIEPLAYPERPATLA